ncbi:hypothetical protein Avbf_08217 [Armadillidium vulgare]|nr:hypothetical protein Avbf_08217 [Armadillidium vulgare]
MKIFKLPRFAKRFIRRHTEQIPLLKSISVQVGGFEQYFRSWWEGNVYGMDKVKNIQTYRIDGFSLVEVKDPQKDTTENKENLG